MAGSLTQILKVGADKWFEEANMAFEKLKMTMMTLPVLAMPDFNLPFEIETCFRLWSRSRSNTS